MDTAPATPHDGPEGTDRRCPVAPPGNGRFPPTLRVAPEQQVPTLRLLGRGDEREALDCLLRSAREGRSGALVVRGEPGISKSALLGCAAGSAAGFGVARSCGVEAEKELSFAALQHLCGPVRGRIAGLPGPQAQALEVAFRLSSGVSPDRFLVGLAVLSLLSVLAVEQPMLWVVDDVQAGSGLRSGARFRGPPAGGRSGRAAIRDAGRYSGCGPAKTCRRSPAWLRWTSAASVMGTRGRC